MNPNEPLDSGPPLAIGDLAERAEVTRRTIRFYVQRGLLAPPLGGGRGSHYTERHLERLLAVKRLQEVGVPLDEILRRLGPPGVPTPPEPPPPKPQPEPPATPAPELWGRHLIAPGVEVLVRADALTPSALNDLLDTARLIARRDQLLAR